MLTQVLTIFSPVLICIGIGFLWVRSHEEDYPSEFLGQLVIKVGAPALIVGTLSSYTVESSQLLELLTATLLMLAVSTILAILVCSIGRLPMSAFVVPLVFGNAGNMGLPLCLFAFGSEGLAMGLTVYIIISLIHFTVGAAVMSGKRPGVQQVLSPVNLAALIALALIITGWQLPKVVSNTLNLLGGMTIPIMLLTLGVSISVLKVKEMKKCLILGTLRLVIGFSAGLLTVELLSLEGVTRGIVLIQSATPAAVFNYLLAVQYKNHEDQMAGLVLASTLLSFVTIPILLAFLTNPAL